MGLWPYISFTAQVRSFLALVLCPTAESAQSPQCPFLCGSEPAPSTCRISVRPVSSLLGTESFSPSSSICSSQLGSDF